jgi:hypothetical protein
VSDFKVHWRDYTIAKQDVAAYALNGDPGPYFNCFAAEADQLISHLRAELEKAEAAGFRRGVEASAHLIDPGEHSSEPHGFVLLRHKLAREIRTLLPKDSP